MQVSRLVITFVIGGFLAGLLIAAITSPASSRPGQRQVAADDWRRTANGWERTGNWPVLHTGPSANQPRSETARRSLRLDTHPAVLALGQLLAVLLAFSAFPARGRQRQGNAEPLFVLIWRSFRASAFGS